MKKGLPLQVLLAAALVVAAGAGWALLSQHDADGAPSGGPPERMAPAPVDLALATLGSVALRVESVGTARARESVEVVAETAGRIAAIGFEEGQRVAAGDVLLALEDARERAELREAQAQREEIGKQLERARQLLRSRNVPEARVDELSSSFEAAEARVAVIESRLRDRRVTAPFDGVVGLREVSLGAYVVPGERITTLDEVAVIRVEFAVPERFLGQLRQGLQVDARSPAFGGNAFIGAVSRLDTRVDPATRSVRVQAEFGNDDGLLRPGMFLNVLLILDEREAVLIAEEAVVTEGLRHHAFVVEDGRAQRRELSLGLRREGAVEVLSGIADGEAVVVSGLQRLRDGAEVQPREGGQAPVAASGG